MYPLYLTRLFILDGGLNRSARVVGRSSRGCDQASTPGQTGLSGARLHTLCGCISNAVPRFDALRSDCSAIEHMVLG
jgi:hypothetical protein